MIFFQRNVLTPTGRRPPLFLSYAGTDRADVDRLYAVLQASPARPEIFQDHRMPPGRKWLDAIQTSATQAVAMVCWTTAAYLRSSYCQYEIGLADATGLRLLPVFLPAEVKRLAPAYLSTVQGIDATAPPDIAGIAQAILASLPGPTP